MPFILLAWLPLAATTAICHGPGCPEAVPGVVNLQATATAVTPAIAAPIVADPPQLPTAPVATAAFDAWSETWAPALSRHNHWMMGYYYLFSFGAASTAEVMPDDYCEKVVGANKDDKCDVDDIKKKLRKYAASVDLLANWHISANQYIMLSVKSLALAKATTYTSLKELATHYQGVKQAWAFLHWQWYLKQADWIVLSDFQPKDEQAEKWVKFVNTASTITCWYAFYEWHVSNRMTMASLTDGSGGLAALPGDARTQAKLVQIWWDEAFIYTIHHIILLKLWSEKFPEQKHLQTAQPFIARHLSFIAFNEVFWGGVHASKVAASRSNAAMRENMAHQVL